VASFCRAVPDIEVHTVSAATGQGVDKLIKLLASRLQKE
jgi:GTP-binding protein